MPRTRAKDYGNVYDSEGLDPPEPEGKVPNYPYLREAENPFLPTYSAPYPGNSSRICERSRTSLVAFLGLI